MKKLIFILFTVILFSTILFSQIHYDTVSSRMVGPGMIHTMIVAPSLPWQISVLQVDLKNPYTKIETIKSNDRMNGGLERVSSMSNRNNSPGHYVVGAINGDFFDFATGNCSQMQIINGEILHRERSGSYASVAVTSKNNFVFAPPVFGGSITIHGLKNTINGINEARGTNGLVLYNSFFGAATGTDASGTEAIVRPIAEWFVNDTVYCIVDSVAPGTGNLPITKMKAVLSGLGTAATFLSSKVNK
jgi:uncharacterized protein YaiE (UPF0345 family)